MRRQSDFMTYRTLYKLFKFKRQGASLVNVCVFFLAATMIMAQVFFFSTTTSETLAEEAKSVERRFSMGQKLQMAFTELQGDTIASEAVTSSIAFSNKVGWKVIDTNNLVSFDTGTRVHTNEEQKIYIYNLNYTLKSLDYAKHSIANAWDNVSIPQRIFPPMGAGYFLVRVLAPGQGLGKKLMYQVVVKRETNLTPAPGSYIVKPLTFQEVWYE